MAETFSQVTPLLRDEQFFDPVTGRGTTRFLQYLEELRGGVNIVQQEINQQISNFDVTFQQVQSFAKVLQSNIDDNSALAVTSNNFSAKLAELEKSFLDVQSAAFQASNINAKLAELSKIVEDNAQIAVSAPQQSQLAELIKRVDDLEQLVNGH